MADGLLVWGGAAYASDGSTAPGRASRRSRTARHSRTTAAAAWLPSRRFATASAALGWECDSVEGPNGRNLTFTVDGDGVIRPAIAPDHAVTAYGNRLVLVPAQGRDDQRWRAGAS